MEREQKLTILANSPGEMSGWVAPVVKRVRQLVLRHKPQVIWATAQPWSTVMRCVTVPPAMTRRNSPVS